MASTWIFWTNQIQIREVGAETDGQCFLGLKRNDFCGLPWRTKDYHGSILRRSFNEIETNIGEKTTRKVIQRILFHHDNAPAHSSKVVRAVLREFWWEILPHPPDSPDLTPYDLFLFPKLKEHLKGVRFRSIDEAKTTVTEWLKMKGAEFFRKGFNRWNHCLQNCMHQ